MKSCVPDSMAVVEMRAMRLEGNETRLEDVPGPLDLVPNLVALQIDQSQFACAVLVAGAGGAVSRILSNELPFPAVCISGASARAHAGILAQRAVRGFALVLGSFAGSTVCIDQLAGRGYTVDPAGTPAKCLRHVFEASGHQPALADAFDLLPHFGARTAICFAHDVDPVYVVDLGS